MGIARQGLSKVAIRPMLLIEDPIRVLLDGPSTAHVTVRRGFRASNALEPFGARLDREVGNTPELQPLSKKVYLGLSAHRRTACYVLTVLRGKSSSEIEDRTVYCPAAHSLFPVCEPSIFFPKCPPADNVFHRRRLPTRCIPGLWRSSFIMT
jgi:hypothetical protein